MAAGYTYILGSDSGTLYIGVTSNLFKRILQHRDGTYEGFSKKYGCYRLLYYEQFEEITIAIGREKQLKGWTRAKKLNLILTKNPTCKDLAEHWGATILFAGESIEEYEACSLALCSELGSKEKG